MIKTWQERCKEHPDHQTGMVSNQMIMARMQEEIDDLRAALAESEQDWSLLKATQKSLREHMSEIHRLRAALAEPEQIEPVAWRTFNGEGGYEYHTYAENENYAAEWAKRNPRHVNWVEPLYADPPKQEQAHGIKEE